MAYLRFNFEFADDPLYGARYLRMLHSSVSYSSIFDSFCLALPCPASYSLGVRLVLKSKSAECVLVAFWAATIIAPDAVVAICAFVAVLRALASMV